MGLKCEIDSRMLAEAHAVETMRHPYKSARSRTFRSLRRHCRGSAVRCEQAMGKGLLFLLRVGISIRYMSDERENSGPVADSQPQRTRRTMKHILVVDDEKHICELYQSELEDEGYTVTLAHSGHEALAAVEANAPDLIVLDIQMPGMDGIETLEKLVGSDKGIPIILNTAYSHYREDFTTWGADAYVVKSSDMSRLKAEIKRLLTDESSG